MKKIAIILFLALAMAGVVYAAGSVTETIDRIPGSSVKIVHINWAADASNADVPDTAILPLNGSILRVYTLPHTDSTIQPQANYDIKLIEHNNGSLDVFNNQAQNRSASANEQFMPTHNNGSLHIYPIYTAVPLMFVHENSTVNSATGRVDIYVDEVR